MIQQDPIPLPGLTGSNPLGALAAFGLLRACSRIPELSRARLGWDYVDDWQAALYPPEQLTSDGLVQLLAGYQRERSLSEFDWNEDIRVDPRDFRERLIDAGQAASVNERDKADYFAAFGSEQVVDRSKGLVKPTAFHMTSGQMRFLSSLVEAGRRLAKAPDEAYREALFGPWRYADDLHSLGFDPYTERMHALRHRAPTSEKPQSVLAAVWLVAEAIPLFPTVAARDRLATTGFFRINGETVFRWPMWREPLTFDTLRSLENSHIIGPERSSREALSALGIRAIYQSVQYRFGQGYGIFRPATVEFAQVSV